MVSKILIASALCVGLLTACGENNSSANSDEARAPVADKYQSTTKGSMDVVVSGETVERNRSGDTNSARCIISFTVTNNSKAEVKSLVLDYHVLNRADGAVIKEGVNMVIAKAINPGKAESPWGEETVDNVRCDAIKLHFPAQPSYQCTTKDKKDCAGFTYSSDDTLMVESD